MRTITLLCGRVSCSPTDHVAAALVDGKVCLHVYVHELIWGLQCCCNLQLCSVAALGLVCDQGSSAACFQSLKAGPVSNSHYVVVLFQTAYSSVYGKQGQSMVRRVT